MTDARKSYFGSFFSGAVVHCLDITIYAPCQKQSIQQVANSAAFIGRPNAKSFQLQGQSSAPDQLRPQTPIIDSCYRARHVPFHSQIASDAPVLLYGMSKFLLNE